MHVMRRLKSIASGRSSVSDPGGDAGIKRAKFEQEAEVEDLGSSTVVAGTSEASEQHMAFVSVESSVAGDAGTSNVAAVPKTANTGVDQLPKEMHEMKIRDDKVDNPDEKEIEATVVNGNGTETGHIIATTIGGRNGQPKQTISYMAERVVGTGSFGIVFQAKCLETGESVAIKKVLQDKRYKNRELQIMRMLDHPNIVQLKHCFFSTTEKDELYLNLVLEYVPETVYRVAKHYSRMSQRMPLIRETIHLPNLSLSCLHSWCCWSLSS